VTDRFDSNLSDLAFGHYRLALLDPETRNIRPVTAFNTGKNINPQWSADGSSLYFASDRDGIPNIYRITLADGRLSQVTDVQTGVTGITALSPAFTLAHAANRLIFSVFANDNYDLYQIDSSHALAGFPLNRKLETEAAATLPPKVRGNEQVIRCCARPNWVW
jgi:hypothetical protein